MKDKVLISGVPVFSVNMNIHHVTYLASLSERHYDYDCRIASRIGGFLYGWDNAIRAGDQNSASVKVTSNEIQICRKILESPAINSNVHDQLDNLFHRLWLLYTRYSTQWQEEVKL